MNDWMFYELNEQIKGQQRILSAEIRSYKRRLTREERNRNRNNRNLLILTVLVWALFIAIVCIWKAKGKTTATFIDMSTPIQQIPTKPIAEAPDIPEDYENEKIEVAMLEKANVIEDCAVTWYTASIEECGKDDGITYSGLPVVEHLTCAVDTKVIPLYADVFVEYADGSIEQLWATDTGVTGNAIDIYTPDYDYAIQCGRQSLTVWWVGP